MSWTVAQPCPTLDEDALHVWRVRTRASGDSLRAIEGLLSADERVRADRYVRERDRVAFVVARATLRTLLGAYLRADPLTIQLGYSVHGKPYLVGEGGQGGLQFNLAHSGEWAVYAFARNRQVGVDLEQIQPMPDLMDIARRFFAASEYEALRSLDGVCRLESFFACWTRKEAYLKARGSGLSGSMGEFEVTVDAAEPPWLIVDHENPADVGRWTFRSIDVGSEYAGAVVVEGQPGRVRFFDA
jgi:4'-phosphopantetheinyl transferase